MTSSDVKNKLYSMGADLCGIASVDRFEAAPQGFHPNDVLPSCKSVISYGIRFVSGTISCKSDVPYTLVRNVLSQRMDNISVEFCIDMEKSGVLAIPIITNQSFLDPRTGRNRCIVSAKHAAQAAGLGTIGRHSLLLTPEFGSMLWLGTILTEYELEPDPLKQPVCNDCGLCVDICPVGALDSEEVDQAKCWNYAFQEPKGGYCITCHKCRDICPFNFGTENAAFKR